MKAIPQLIIAAALLGASLFLSACSSPEVQDARQSGLNRRQDRIDSRTAARQDRWEERAERQDARTNAAFDRW